MPNVHAVAEGNGLAVALAAGAAILRSVCVGAKLGGGCGVSLAVALGAGVGEVTEVAPQAEQIQTKNMLK